MCESDLLLDEIAEESVIVCDVCERVDGDGLGAELNALLQMAKLQVKCCQVATDAVISFSPLQLALESSYSLGYLALLRHSGRLGQYATHYYSNIIKYTCLMDHQAQKFAFRFVKQYDTAFGEALYLSGNINQLGNWDPQRAIKLNFEGQSTWAAQVAIPQNVDIEFKYFLASFNANLALKPKMWIGNENSRLRIEEKIAKHFRQRDDDQLKIMSFNVRFENESDKNERSWASRKDNCAQVIIAQFPDFIGVQQPKKSQRDYLISKIGSFYDYYGKPRDLKEDQNSGIFLRKDKFRLIEDGYLWINENKIPGRKGFGARLPRYFTYLLVAPFSSPNRTILVFNTHLDHQTPASRLHGIKFMAETIQDLNKRYNDKVKNIFVTGDFNTSDDDLIFQHLNYKGELLKSMRHALPNDKSDHGATFNGFTKMLKYIDKTMKFFNLDPGATIDHIFFRSESYKPISFKCIKSEEKIVSDHFPIMGIFECTK